MEEKTFEEKLEELENIVTKLERENVALKESVELYQKAQALSKELNQELEEAMKKMSFIVEDGEVKPFSDEETDAEI